MRSVPRTFDVDDLAQGLAALAAEILSCEVADIDLSMEAPAPLEPGKVELGWSSTVGDASGGTSSRGGDESAASGSATSGTEPSNGAVDAVMSDAVMSDAVTSDAVATTSTGRKDDRSSRDDRGRRGDASDELTPQQIDAEADAAADFLEGLLDAMDISGDLRLDPRDSVIEVEIVEADSGSLIGRRGQTLESIQEMLRSSMQRQFQRRSRVVVDVEGYRRRRLEKFLEDAEAAIQDVLSGEDSVRLEPMDVYERKQVHQLVANHDGLVSRSHGREPSRRVVIEQA